MILNGAASIGGGSSGPTNSLYIDGVEYKYTYKDYLSMNMSQITPDTYDDLTIQTTKYDGAHVNFGHTCNQLIYMVTDPVQVESTEVNSRNISFIVPPESGRKQIDSFNFIYNIANRTYTCTVRMIMTKTYMTTQIVARGCGGSISETLKFTIYYN